MRHTVFCRMGEGAQRRTHQSVEYGELILKRAPKMQFPARLSKLAP